MSGAFAAGLALLCAAAIVGVLPGLGRAILPRPASGRPGGRRPPDWGLGLIAAAAYLLAAAGSACLVVSGAGAVAGRPAALGLDHVLGSGLGRAGHGRLADLIAVGHVSLAADRLSGLFLLIAFSAAVPVSLVAAGRAGRHRPEGADDPGTLGPGAGGPGAGGPGAAGLSAAGLGAAGLGAAGLGAGESLIRRGRLGAACALTLASVAVVITAQGAFVLLFAWESLTIAFYLLAGFDRHRPGRPAARS